VDTALEALAGIDSVTVSGNAGGPYTITFGGTQANTDVSQITADPTFLTSGTLSRTLSFAYDAASQLTSTSDPDSSYAYTYDNLSRILTVSNSGTSGVPTVVLTSAYDANSRRTSLAGTVGGTADFLNSYTYDNLGRLTRVDQTGNGGATVANKRADFAYNALGQFTSIARQVKPSSTWNEVATSTFTYDTLNRITALDHKIGSTDIANYDWTYDALNRVTQLSSGDGTSDYTYDKESELTAADHSFQTDESYTYNATGNRTNTGYTTGTNNRMTSDGTYNYTYDDEGNRLTRTKISDSSLTEYTWDHRNRLTKVVERATGTGGAITKQTDYKYDIFDRRISKSYDADGAGGGSAVVSRFAYDGDHIALQFDGSNNLTHRYLHGPAVDQILADEDSSNNILWPLTDNLGTVRDLVNSSGTVQNHLKYDSFGKVTTESNSAVDHLFAYTGRERDEETGLQYHRARYYDPATGRFISEDPKGFAAGDPNLSRYVGNNATNLVDPFGLDDGPPLFAYMLGQDGDAAYAAWFDQYYADYNGGSGGSWNPFTDIYVIATNLPSAAAGYWTGLNDGSSMVINAATFHMCEPLNDHVNQIIDQNGGLYQTANYSAHIGVGAAYAAAALELAAAYGVSHLGTVTLTQLPYQASIEYLAWMTFYLSYWSNPAGPPPPPTPGGISNPPWQIPPPDGPWDIGL